MNSTPWKRGHLPTSTPNQSLGDSGYFGSDRRPSIKKGIHTLSPIKEHSPSKKRYTDLVKFGRTYSLETPQHFRASSNVIFESTPCVSHELAKELSFDELSDFSESLHVTEQSNVRDSALENNPFPCLYLPDFSFSKFEADHKENLSNCDQSCDLLSPVANENDFKAKVSAKEKVDFLKDLQKISGCFIASSILSFLSPDDLCKMCCVSETWKDIVVFDVKANSRRKDYLSEKRAQKENMVPKTQIEVIREKKMLAGERKTVLCDVANTITFKQPLDNSSRFDCFIKEGQNLREGTLMKCPLCQFPAKKACGDEYCCTKCNYSFCRSCLNPYLKKHVCYKGTVSIIIGSKRSKKSLKRL